MVFNKLVIFTDIHLGKKNNSDIHGNDCMDFLDWMISQAKEFGGQTCICLGDFHDIRASINIKTLNYSIKALEKLSAAFEKTYIILGNHDLFHKNQLDVHSLRYGDHVKNIKIIDRTTVIDNCAFIPWIADNNFEQLRDIKSKYVFGHLELPNFFMNSLNLMPDFGQANADMFDGPKYVFSGHFHKRQHYTNKNGTEIIYIGNAFPHNYSDTDDIARGCVLLENDGEPQFVNWADCPKYKISGMAELLENPEDILSEKTYLRIQPDLEITYDEINFIRDTLQKQFKAREVILLHKKSDEFLQDFSGQNVEFKSVDNIVLNHIDNLDTETFDKKLLSEIYLGL